MAKSAKSAQVACAKNSATRARDWGSIFYEESLAKNWQSILDTYCIRYAVSPWHDNDFDEFGKLKKKHRHALFKFESLKSYVQVKEITDSINATCPIQIKSSIGNIRYFFHLDNPEKFQYEIKNYIDHGVGILKIIKMSGDKDEVYVDMTLELTEFVREFDFLNIDDVWLFMKAHKEQYKDLLLFSTKHYGMTKHLCDANYNRLKNSSD